MASSAIIAAPALAREGSLMKIAVPKEGILKPKSGIFGYNGEVGESGLISSGLLPITDTIDSEGQIYTFDDGEGLVTTIPRVTCTVDNNGVLTLSDGDQVWEVCAAPVKAVALEDHLALQQRLESLESLKQALADSEP